ncbi:MAG: hypothetical protein QW249_01445 [Desulfurococcaceae archaeon]
MDGNSKYFYVRVYYDQRTPDNVDPPATRVFIRENGEEEMVFGQELLVDNRIVVHYLVDAASYLQNL